MRADYGPRYYAVNGREITQREWSHSLDHYRHIGLDYVRLRGHTYRVSTVWLGLDHGWFSARPLIFETMVFEGYKIARLGDFMERYSTLREAQRGHIMITRRLKRTVRTMPRHPQLIHNGRKPVGRPTKRK